MKILILCGSRAYAHYRRVHEAVGRERGEIRVVLQGGARGADSHAKNAAVLHRVPWEQWDAEWNVYGRSAGMLRNERMLQRAREWQRANPGDTVEVWAFKDDLWGRDPVTGGNGTLDMVERAAAAGVPVRWWGAEGERAVRWNPYNSCVEVAG